MQKQSKEKTALGTQLKVGLKSIAKNYQLYLLLLPGLLWFLAFAYRPMSGLRIAFYDYNIFRGFEGSEFVGLKNFVDFLTGRDFIRVFKNTLMISFWQIAVCFPVPILLAICVTEMKNKFVSKLTQTATLLPHFVSVVVVCGMVVNFLSPSTGIINMILSKLGFEPTYFMVQPQYFRGIYTGMTLWQNAGFNALVFIAAIMGIDPQLYEAATVDGGSRFRQFISITLPMLTPVLFFNLVQQTINAFMAFTQSFVITGGGPRDSTRFYCVYQYQRAFEFHEMGYASAMAWFMLVVIGILTALIFQSSTRWVYNESKEG